MQASNFAGTVDQLSFEFFMKFSQKMPLYFFYTMVQKSKKWSKTQIKGSCLESDSNNATHCASCPAHDLQSSMHAEQEWTAALKSNKSQTVSCGVVRLFAQNFRILSKR